MLSTEGGPSSGDSTLLVTIPEAEPAIGALRLAHDPVAGAGIPAHVTVLYPFVPRERLTDDVRDAISALFASMAAFDYRFEATGRFGSTTLYLAPEPARAFSGLTAATHARWPEHPPYGGVFDVVVPHLTIADRLDGSTADVLEGDVRSALMRHGPIVGRAADVVLMTRDAGGRWSVDSRHPLAD